jgi:hypothetical protein
VFECRLHTPTPQNRSETSTTTTTRNDGTMDVDFGLPDDEVVGMAIDTTFQTERWPTVQGDEWCGQWERVPDIEWTAGDVLPPGSLGEA